MADDFASTLRLKGGDLFYTGQFCCGMESFPRTSGFRVGEDSAHELIESPTALIKGNCTWGEV